MAISARIRRLVLGIGLGVSLLAASWVMSRDKPEPEVIALRGPDVVTSSKSEAREAPPSTFADLDLNRLKREAPPSREKMFDAFERETWVKLLPPPKPVPPPLPSAPPLPFAYMGSLVENGTITAFLTKQDRPYPVKTGSTIDDLYRVDEITEQQVVLTYLPLNQKQIMQLWTTH